MGGIAFLLGSLLVVPTVWALNEPCQVENSRLDPNSHKFHSDCGPMEYCAPTVLQNSTTSASSNKTLSRRSHFTPQIGFSALKHQTRLSRRGHLQNVFLAGLASTYSNETSEGDKADDSSEVDGEDTASDAGFSVLVQRMSATVSPTPTNSTGTCQLKGCRTDEFPFGYGPDDVLPPRCPVGQYCPDNEDKCQPLIPVGGPCEMNRDDSCQPAANYTLFVSESNFNGSVCLSYTCMYADKQVSENCIIDNTIYSGDLPDGSQFTDIVSRDNCSPGLYCSSDGQICAERLAVGESCKIDGQCLSGNCDVSNKCVGPPETPSPVPRALYVVLPLFICGGMAGLTYSLWLFHQRARKRRNETLYEYWTEQLAYRRSIINMHLAAQQEQKRAFWVEKQ